MMMFDFGIFTKYIKDDFITDINYNGKAIWIDDINLGRFKVSETLNEAEVENFCYRIANFANAQFNHTYPILECETNNLRISILHKSISISGYSISIRKTPPLIRLKTDALITSNYATKELLNTLSDLVRNRNNIIISGLPGVGKTELLKYLTKSINDNERVITIEDNLEIRYPTIHPNKDGLMIKVNKQVDYRDAIKSSLRQRVDWILLSEVRGDEVVELLQAVSTGSSLLSTIHSDSARTIPKRILHMFPGNEIVNEKLLFRIYESIDYGIHIKSSISDKGIHRYISEVVQYCTNNDQVEMKIIYERDRL